MNPEILPIFTGNVSAEGDEVPEKVKKVEAKPKDTANSKPATKKAAVVHSPLLDGWKPEKQYYSIGEVASLFKVNTSHIRFWTKEFLTKVRTTKKGDRLYTPAQIAELGGIYQLVKEKGFTLAGAKAKLREEKKESAETANLKESLLILRNQLSSIRSQLS
jgi:DNA-binding transcriptional MerR regulator